MPDTLTADTTLTVPELSRMISARPGFVRIDHSSVDQRNLTVISRKSDDARVQAWAKSIVVELARHGYVLYMVSDGVSRFLRQDKVAAVWHRVKDGEFKISEGGVIYSITPPKIETSRPKLLVMFSTIHDQMYSPSLLRYFMENFKTIQKFIPPETAILRVADLGGVTGAFYLDTVYAENNAAKVQQVILDAARQLEIDHDQIVLYGASKGGTGALYHAMQSGWKCVAVDPIVSDEHYEKEWDDSHFTGSGVFPRSKQAVFKEAVTFSIESGAAAANSGRWAIICSDRSPQFPYIKEILIDRLQSTAFFVNSQHPDITEHPHVGVKTVNWSTMLLNMFFYGFQPEPGLRTEI